MKFILASASPRRRDILNSYGFDFDVIPSKIEEIVEKRLPPEKVAERLAEIKAEDVFARFGRPTLGADTIVVIGGEILGKPKNRDSHRKMLKKLSGKTHSVITGYAYLTNKGKTVASERSLVTFRNLSDEEIEGYIDSGLGDDKAGGYGIQDEAGLVSSVEGSYFNVVGLPIEKIEPLIKGDNK